MKLDELKEKYADNVCDRPYRRIQILINGSDSTWKDDIKLEIITDECHLRSFIVHIKKFLDRLDIDRPYSIYNAKREEKEDDIYIKNVFDLEKVLNELADKLRESLDVID